MLNPLFTKTTPLQIIDKALADVAFLKFKDRICAERTAGQPQTIAEWRGSQEFRDYRMAYRDIANNETGRS